MVGEYLVSAWEENKTMWQIYRWFDGSYLCKSGGRDHTESLKELQENMTCLKVNGNKIEDFFVFLT